MRTGLQLQYFGSKFRKKALLFVVIIQFYIQAGQTKTESSDVDNKCGDNLCINGECIDGNCTCYAGWKGPSCQLCGGRVRLTEPEGVITHGIGNYSIDMQCTWLVDGSKDNRTIQLYMDSFATECGWDHVYIFDGDSVYSNLLAVYSGMVQLDKYASHNLTSLEAKSGAAYIHFYSDAAYNMTGFKITYRYHSCPSVSSRLNCSGNGACDPESGQCTCNAGWSGRACSEPHCPRDCSGRGVCDPQQHRCRCHDGYTGSDCSQGEELGYWELLPPSKYVPPGRASHASVVKGDSIWLLGGESFAPSDFVVKYDVNGGVWEPFHTRGPQVPKPRYGHSAVLRGDNIYMYGGVTNEGVTTRELWALDTTTQSWEAKNVRPDVCYREVCGPLAVVGHSAVVVSDDRMLVLFGHSPVYGYVNYVQAYHFGTGKWSVHGSRGALLKGSYGHSSVWDAHSGLVYVYGGHLSDNIATYFMSNLLHALNPDTMEWTRLSSVDSSRFLHSAVMLDGLMLVFGGNTHNDTSYSQGARCYSQSFLAYDPSCDRWHRLTSPLHFHHDLSRYGHAAVVFEGSMYVVGGYNGRMFNDVLRFRPGRCDGNGSSKSCLASATIGAKCAWNVKARACEPFASAGAKTHVLCNADDEGDGPSAADECAAIAFCPTCIFSKHDCVWCGKTCAHQKCKGISKPITSADQCQANYASNCNLLHNCHACHTEPYCKWEHDHKCYTYIVETKEPPIPNNKTEREMVSKIQQAPCGPSCSERTTCDNCTAASCMWCINKMRCVENNAYVASFPYGQCMEWTTQKAKCDVIPPGGSSCNAHQTCERCQEDPGCGWCDNGSGTGVGSCLAGGFSGPLDQQCPNKLWNFLSCPPCQCNGHSTCYPGNSTCQPCGDLTDGDHCHICQPGFFGDPVNGGKCQPCDCNNHGTDCHSETGKCYCNTKGIIGDHCERCDTQNKFLGDPSSGDDCFYNLALDFQFTFNMTKSEDLHFKRINFMNRPIRSDLNTDFHITCSQAAKMNITVKTVLEAERVILADYNCTQYERTFTQSEYNFGTPDNTTFYVYVYNLRPPLFVQVAFSQHPRLNLRQFFITFSTCFLLLLLIAGLLWKIKQKYDNYRRRQRLFVEMEQMASRPYAQALLEVVRRGSAAPAQPVAVRKRHRAVPCPIVLEQCSGNRAALITVVIESPTGGQQYSPAGVSGIIVGTALVADGTSGKDSVDRSTKADSKKTQKTVPPGAM
ncbi:attractin-like protein 1 [Pollicipes pollicipes]|uniref:attractin-like protein 1 n=1 Tax=Pollicipes pollicipes TaxID=41117 RepID=UPI001885A3A7|nr:attractin-like protein 1 [Pollicipes pollicipes]